jgi:hypothetical protein
MIDIKNSLEFVRLLNGSMGSYSIDYSSYGNADLFPNNWEQTTDKYSEII